jgi:hypothetical protein
MSNFKWCPSCFDECWAIGEMGPPQQSPLKSRQGTAIWYLGDGGLVAARFKCGNCGGEGVIGTDPDASHPSDGH